MFVFLSLLFVSSFASLLLYLFVFFVFLDLTEAIFISKYTIYLYIY